MTFRQVTAMKPKCAAQSQKSLYYLLYGKENKQLTKPKNIMKAKGAWTERDHPPSISSFSI